MKRRCPVCGACDERAREFLPDTFERSRLTPFTYASRKKPEHMSLRLVRCLVAAESDVSPYLRCGTFDANAHEASPFDLVCCMMTLEHVREPLQLAEGARTLLRPGGLFAAAVHDYQSLINRLLGSRSPIVDIEHLQLFSRRAATEVFVRAGLGDITVRTFINKYRFEYWLRLAPLPRSIGSRVTALAHALRVADRRIACNVGNIVVTGFA